MQDVGSFNEESVSEIFALLFSHYSKEDVQSQFEGGAGWTENEAMMTRMSTAHKVTLREVVLR